MAYKMACSACDSLTYVCDQLLGAAAVLAYRGFDELATTVAAARRSVVTQIHIHCDEWHDPDDEPPGQAQGPA